MKNAIWLLFIAVMMTGCSALMEENRKVIPSSDIGNNLASLESLPSGQDATTEMELPTNYPGVNVPVSYGNNFKIVKITEGKNYYDGCVLEDKNLWLGQIIDAGGLPEDKINEVVLKRAPYKFSISLVGVSSVVNTADGTQSGYVSDWNSLVSQDLVRKQPGSLTFQKDYLHSSSDLGFKLGFGVGIKASVVKASIDSSFNWNSSTAKTRVLVKFTQALYHTDIDKPADPADFFASDVTFEDIRPKLSGSVCPVYVSSITYGRMGYLCLESDDMEADVNQALNAFIGISSFNANASASSKISNVLNNSKMMVVMRGTGVEGGQYIDGLEGFIGWIKSLTNQNDITVGVPISFHLNYLKDNYDAIVYKQNEEVAVIYTSNNSSSSSSGSSSSSSSTSSVLCKLIITNTTGNYCLGYGNLYTVSGSPYSQSCAYNSLLNVNLNIPVMNYYCTNNRDYYLIGVVSNVSIMEFNVTDLNEYLVLCSQCGLYTSWTNIRVGDILANPSSYYHGNYNIYRDDFDLGQTLGHFSIYQTL